MIAQSDHLEIEGLMARYFDGLYRCDVAMLRKVFHDQLSYVNATAGQYEFLGLEAYMLRIDMRTSPAVLNEPREEKIEEITLLNREMGTVVAHMSMLNRRYQDLLTVIRTDEGWRVLNKVFTYIEMED